MLGINALRLCWLYNRAGACEVESEGSGYRESRRCDPRSNEGLARARTATLPLGMNGSVGILVLATRHRFACYHPFSPVFGPRVVHLFLGFHVSQGNSGIVHAGFDDTPGYAENERN